MRSFQDSIEQMLWPERAREGHPARRQDPGRDRSRATARRQATARSRCTSRSAPAICPTSCRRRSARISSCSRRLHRRRHRDRSDSARHADRSAGQRATCSRRTAIREQRASTTARSAALMVQSARAAAQAWRQRHRRAGPGGVQGSRRPAARREQVPGLHRQPRASVRHRRCRTPTSAR